jgi:hypothetical protein
MPLHLLGCVLLPVITLGEVGRSKDHSNHSPFHRAILSLHAFNFGMTFDSAACISRVDDVT